MTACMRGGLLSDIFLHLVPHSFLGKSEGVEAKLVLVEEKRNILIGLGSLSFIGLAAFFVSNGELIACLGCKSVNRVSSGVAAPSKEGLRTQASEKLLSKKTEAAETKVNAPSKLSTRMLIVTSQLNRTYLNLFGDIVHNITDDLVRESAGEPGASEASLDLVTVVLQALVLITNPGLIFVEHSIYLSLIQVTRSFKSASSK
ncbi:hypothetical protein K439DRAFT_1619291 [Ramaria rubella]|nr:hypothetical protein K439DRAFT_1619291 [Ramaria rubella]